MAGAPLAEPPDPAGALPPGATAGRRLVVGRAGGRHAHRVPGPVGPVADRGGGIGRDAEHLPGVDQVRVGDLGPVEVIEPLPVTGVTVELLRDPAQRVPGAHRVGPRHLAARVRGALPGSHVGPGDRMALGGQAGVPGRGRGRHGGGERGLRRRRQRAQHRDRRCGLAGPAGHLRGRRGRRVPPDPAELPALAVRLCCFQRTRLTPTRAQLRGILRLSPGLTICSSGSMAAQESHCVSIRTKSRFELAHRCFRHDRAATARPGSASPSGWSRW